MLSSFHQTFDEQEQDLFSTKDKAPPCLTVMKEQQNCVKQLVGIFIYLLKKNKQDYCLNIVMMMSSCLEYIEGWLSLVGFISHVFSFFFYSVLGFSMM